MIEQLALEKGLNRALGFFSHSTRLDFLANVNQANIKFYANPSQLTYYVQLSVSTLHKRF